MPILYILKLDWNAEYSSYEEEEEYNDNDWVKNMHGFSTGYSIKSVGYEGLQKFFSNPIVLHNIPFVILPTENVLFIERECQPYLNHISDIFLTIPALLILN